MKKTDYLTELDVKKLQQEANNNNPLAIRLLATLHCHGVQVEQDYKIGFQLFVKAAKLGDTEAQYNLSMMYENGIGIPKNVLKSIRYGNLAAQGGNKNALIHMAFRYSYGEGIIINPKLALDYFKKAAELESDVAMFEVGLIYHKGIAVKRNLDMAAHWYKKAIALGNDDANFNLAAIKDDNKVIRSRTSSYENGKNVHHYEFIGTLQDYKKYLDKEYEKIFEVNNF